MSELHSIVRNASVHCLKFHSRREDISLAELPAAPLVFAHWMSLILVAGSVCKVTFKVHFMTRGARYFAANPYGCPPEKVTSSQAADFIKEYCNLVGGHVMLVLNESEIRLGLSIPILTRGFDEAFFPRPAGSTVDFWRLSSGDQILDLSAHVELYEDLKLKPAQKPLESLDDQGEVNFF